MALATEFTRRLGLSTPVMLAPMAGISGGALAAAVTRSGGLGFIGGGYCDIDWIRRQIDIADETPVGIGFITWALQQNPGALNVALERRPRAIFLSFGDIGPYVECIKRARIPVYAQIQTVAGARAAVDQGADIIVAQGAEAGGHGATRGTLALVPAVKDAVVDVPVVAAGGIADGRTIAACLMLGADAVLCGTSFYAAEESLAHPNKKQAAVAASGDDTVRSSVFDAARGLDWPRPWTLRALRNAFHDRWEGNVTAIGRNERLRHASATAAGDTDVSAVIVGEGVDMVRTIEPANKILMRMVRQAEPIIAHASHLLLVEEQIAGNGPRGKTCA